MKQKTIPLAVGKGVSVGTDLLPSEALMRSVTNAHVQRKQVERILWDVHVLTLFISQSLLSLHMLTKLVEK